MTHKVETFASITDAQRFYDAVQRLSGYPSRTVTHRGHRAGAAPFGGTRNYIAPARRTADSVYEIAVPDAIDGMSLTIHGQLQTMNLATASDSSAETAVTRSTNLYTRPFGSDNPLLTSWHIGNSLTYNFGAALWTYLEVWSDAMGQRLAAGGQYLSSQSVQYQLDNIGSYSTPSTLGPRPDSWDAYLPTADLDVLSVQCYHAAPTPTTLNGDVATVEAVCDACNSVSRVLLYVPYPPLASTTEWTSVVGVTGTTNTRHSQEYAAAWLAACQASRPAVDYAVFAPGEIFHYLEQAAGTIPGIDARADLYGDPIHASLLGGWAVVAGMWAVIHQRPATDMDVAATWEDSAAGSAFTEANGITQAFADACLPVVEQAVSQWR